MAKLQQILPIVLGVAFLLVMIYVMTKPATQSSQLDYKYYIKSICKKSSKNTWSHPPPNCVASGIEAYESSSPGEKMLYSTILPIADECLLNNMDKATCCAWKKVIPVIGNNIALFEKATNGAINKNDWPCLKDTLGKISCADISELASLSQTHGKDTALQAKLTQLVMKHPSECLKKVFTMMPGNNSNASHTKGKEHLFHTN